MRVDPRIENGENFLPNEEEIAHETCDILVKSSYNTCNDLYMLLAEHELIKGNLSKK